MTLIKKILTTSLPLTLVGIATPTIVSCSCHKNSLTLEYGKQINCLNKDDTNYHKHKDVSNAIKPHAYKLTRETSVKQDELNQFNVFIKTPVGIQVLFWDLSASYVIQKNCDINLKDWQPTDQCTATFNLNSVSYDSTNLTYWYDAQDKLIKIILSDSESVTSYLFRDCTFSTIGNGE